MALWPFRRRPRHAAPLIKQPVSGANAYGPTLPGIPALAPYDAAPNARVLVERACGWAYCCVNNKAKQIAMQPLRLYSDGRRRGATIRGARLDAVKAMTSDLRIKAMREAVEIEDHPFLTLMSAIRPYASGYDYLWGLVVYLETLGSSYDYMATAGMTDIVAELWPLLPHYVTVVPHPTRFIEGFEYKPGINKKVFTPDQILWIKHPSPYTYYKGYSPTEAVFKSIGLAEHIETFQLGMLANMGAPNLWIKMAGNFGAEGEDGDASYAQLVHRWMQRIRRAVAAPFITDNRVEAIENMATSPKELDLTESDLKNMKKIAGGYGVPISILLPDDANRSISYEARRQYASDTLTPLCIQLAAAFNEQLVPRFGDGLFCAFDVPEAVDLQQRTLQDQIHVTIGTRTVNELRARDGFEPIEGGDDPPWARAMAIAEVSAAARPVPGEVRERAKAHHGECECVRCKAKLPYITATQAEREALRDFGKAIQRLLRQQRDEVRAKINAEHPRSEWTLDRAKWDKLVAGEAEPFIQDTAAESGQRALGTLPGVSIDFDLEYPEARRFIETEPLKFAQGLNAQTVKDLRAAIDRGILDGLSIDRIADAIAEIPAFGEDRSERIARTEISRAANYGAELAYMQSGVVSGKQWSAAGDSCAFCAEMESKYGPNSNGLPLGRSFLKEGDVLTAGDDSYEVGYTDIEAPPLHPNCRCALIPVVEAAPQS